MTAERPTPANTPAKALRDLADELERVAMSYLLAAARLRANADKEWLQ